MSPYTSPERTLANNIRVVRRKPLDTAALCAWATYQDGIDPASLEVSYDGLNRMIARAVQATINIEHLTMLGGAEGASIMMAGLARCGNAAPLISEIADAVAADLRARPSSRSSSPGTNLGGGGGAAMGPFAPVVVASQVVRAYFWARRGGPGLQRSAPRRGRRLNRRQN